MARTKQRPRRAASMASMAASTADHDNIYDPVSPYNVVMTPRRSQRNCSVTSGPSNNSTMAMPQQQGATVQDQRPLPSLLTASDPSTSPALTTTTLPRLSRRAATEDDADSRFVLNWVQANYQYEPNHNVPRSGMYEDYKAACVRCHQQPVNSATFGKLIRHVFSGITTRRLGTRGESKYHYCGIRRRMGPPPPPASFSLQSPAAILSSSSHDISGQPPPPSSGVNPNIITRSHAGNTTAADMASSSNPAHTRMNIPLAAADDRNDDALSIMSYDRYHHHAQQSSSSFQAPSSPQQQAMYGESGSSGTPSTPLFQLPEFAIHTPSLQNNQTAIEFSRVYEQHCRDILAFIHSNQINNVYTSMVSFYQMLPDRFRNLIDDYPQAIDDIWRWDCSLYDSIMVHLLPNIYTPITFGALKQLRNYTRQLQQYIRYAVDASYPDELYQKKTSVAKIFVSKFKRHLKLSQMAQTTLAVLQHPNNFESMRRDWDAVDFESIMEQATWVCNCNHQEVQDIFQNGIKRLLYSEAGLHDWITWIQGIVERYMSTPSQQAPTRNPHSFVLHAKEFIHKWNFYSSLILKDLSLGHAASAGLFRTLRHFIDDMMLYLVEERLARIYRDDGPKHQHQHQPSHQSQTQATASGSSSGTGAPPHTNEDTTSTTAVIQPEPSTVEMEISSNDSP